MAQASTETSTGQDQGGRKNFFVGTVENAGGAPDIFRRYSFLPWWRSSAEHFSAKIEMILKTDADFIPNWAGDWKVARTRRLESLRHVAQTFLSAGCGDFPVPTPEQ
ncbi:MAG TPA: hypothetical protein VFB72_01525 [Verrucomicrobiae bacterium]|nr:hypothetical protein [Verrucomicrobiae bacterium]